MVFVRKDNSIRFCSINLKFLQDVQILLTTLGVSSSIKLNNMINEIEDYILYINTKSVNKLMDIGFSPRTFNLIYNEHEKFNHTQEIIKVVSIEKISENEATYCFNEPKKHRGIFNGILTCQSETYSLLIETYIKDTLEKNKLFNAIDHFPCIKNKFK